jgi:hypothetical protein
MKSGLIRGVVSLQGDNLKLFHYLSASEIWPDKRVACGGSGLIREGLQYKVIKNLLMDQNFALSYMYLSKRLKYEKTKFDSNFRSLKQQSADGHFNPLGYTILTPS